ncbi:hypothetical protein CKO25_07615 [Thiocapsa imhoffii]|uniref:Type II secretion system protein H n=1 Tax=Thiocapsa imhoffii TaxID=382777 RepID=A0A9X1B8R6_9GAMM|nr:GspH/FimT family pseudopilin [Thiocapsa imhoffii]MBK1644523.1 hypothetical protein [Thiocapsa imhoffii]
MLAMNGHGRPLNATLARNPWRSVRSGCWCAPLARRRAAGLTLLELLFTIVILAILLSVAVPSFQGLAQRDRITDTTNDLLMAFQLGRSEAIRYRTQATVCAANADQTACAVADPPWSTGWVLFRQDDQTETRIRVGTAPAAGVTITTAVERVRFRADGSAQIVGAAVGTFEIDSEANRPRCIRILPSGFISMERMACPTVNPQQH